jgi:amidase
MNPAPGNDVCALPARELARRIAGRELSAVEALDAHLARIERWNPELNAVVSLDIEAARRQAAAADAVLARGEILGPLHGVPLTLKDGNDVAGLRTTIGTGIFDRLADEDGAVAARLRTAGAIIIGHTNVPPFGVQIVGPRWSEMHLLGVCRTLESVQALPGFRPPPELSAPIKAT